jgi:tetratricopeptide (TPR) repeat protein
LARSLAELLAAEPLADKQRCLVASLNLSLQRLDGDLLAVLPRLGVFQGGALEHQIFQIMMVFPPVWPSLKSVLEQTGLIQVENDIEITFLRFHPTLAPVLWGRLPSAEQEDLRLWHQKQYYGLVAMLCEMDRVNPFLARWIARRELPNLLWAVKGALENRAADFIDFVDSYRRVSGVEPDRSENVVDFVNQVNHFLNIFGLERDRSFLTKRLNQFLSTTDLNWYLVLSTQGKQLYESGQYFAATEIFEEILQKLGSEPSIGCFTNTLFNLGRCYQRQGQLNEAFQLFQEGLDVLSRLDQDESVRQQRGTYQEALGDALAELGEFQQAQQAYEDSLAIYEEFGDLPNALTLKFQMASLAMRQGELVTAAQLYQEVLQNAQQLQDPNMEARVCHQLGIMHEKEQNWSEADRAYRKSARIKEQQGNIVGASSTYLELGILSKKMNKPVEAEAWYRKALQVLRSSGNKLHESHTLDNLAMLIAGQPSRLQEAEQLAEDALEIMKTLDPRAAEIWKTYNTLANIITARAEIVGVDTLKENRSREYRHLSRVTYFAYAGSDRIQHELEYHTPLIISVLFSLFGDDATRAFVEPELELLLVRLVENGRGKLVAAIRRVLAGERSVEALWTDLDIDDSVAINGILREITYRRHAPFIELVVAAVEDAAVREQLEPVLVQSVENGAGQLVAAIRRVLAGEREIEALWDDLDVDDSMIIAAILGRV